MLNATEFAGWNWNPIYSCSMFSIIL